MISSCLTNICKRVNYLMESMCLMYHEKSNTVGYSINEPFTQVIKQTSLGFIENCNSRYCQKPWNFYFLQNKQFCYNECSFGVQGPISKNHPLNIVYDIHKGGLFCKNRLNINEQVYTQETVVIRGVSVK